MPTPHNAYKTIFNQISKILEETRKDFKEGSNRFVLTSNWEIGKRITEIEQGGKVKPKYGEKIITKLSTDLNKRFGSGYSEKNLFGMRKLYQNYKLNQIQFALNWSQYRSLLTIKDPNVRNGLEAEAVEKGWTQRKLEAVIRYRIRNNDQNGEKANEKGLLERSNGLFYHYRIGSSKKLLKTGDSRRFVDLGFYFGIECTLGDIVKGKKIFAPYGSLDMLGDTENSFKEDEIVKVIKTGRSSYKFEKTKASKSEIFTYQAFPERIVDGDTLLVSIDLGFRTSVKQRLRFRGVDSSEKGSKENEKVEKFISKRLRPVKFIVIKTHGVDLYGRYLADIYFLEKEKNMEKVLEKGNFLNNELLESKLVRVD